MSASIRSRIDEKPSDVQAISNLQSMIWNYSSGLDLKYEDQVIYGVVHEQLEEMLRDKKDEEMMEPKKDEKLEGGSGALNTPPKYLKAVPGLHKIRLTPPQVHPKPSTRCICPEDEGHQQGPKEAKIF